MRDALSQLVLSVDHRLRAVEEVRMIATLAKLHDRWGERISDGEKKFQE